MEHHLGLLWCFRVPNSRYIIAQHVLSVCDMDDWHCLQLIDMSPHFTGCRIPLLQSSTVSKQGVRKDRQSRWVLTIVSMTLQVKKDVSWNKNFPESI